MAKKKIKVGKIDISVLQKEGLGFISIRDIVRKFSKNPIDIIKNYLRNGQNLEHRTVWEQLHNINFKTVLADRFKVNSIKIVLPYRSVNG